VNLGYKRFIIAVVVLLMLQAVGCSRALTSGEVVAKACATTNEVESYRMTVSTIRTCGEQTSEIFSEDEFAAADCWHTKITINGSWYEFITIGDKQYNRDSDKMEWRLCNVPSHGEGAVTTGPCVCCVEELFQHPKLLINLEKLPDEGLNGVACLHYRGKVDIDLAIEEYKARLESQLDARSSEYQEALKALEQQKRQQTDVELWIGKEDYLIRQMKWDTQMPVMEATTSGETEEEKWCMTNSLAKYYDFNESIEVKPPL
jgi:hypothetical protein